MAREREKAAGPCRHQAGYTREVRGRNFPCSGLECSFSKADKESDQKIAKGDATEGDHGGFEEKKMSLRPH